jgi:uncharacterized protein
MALEMKPECEKCRQALPANSTAMICSYECTFCQKCTSEMKNVSKLGVGNWYSVRERVIKESTPRELLSRRLGRSLDSGKGPPDKNS